MHIRDFSISTRLFSLTVFLLLVTIACGLTGWFSLQRSNDQLNWMAHRAQNLAGAADAAHTVQLEFKSQVQSWKNLLIRGIDIQEFNRYKEDFLEKGRNTQTKLAALDAQLTELGMPTPLPRQAAAILTEMQASYLAALEQYMLGDPDSVQIVDSLVVGVDEKPNSVFDSIVAFVQSENQMRTDRNLKAAGEQYRNIVMWLAIVTGLGILLGLAFTFWVVRGIVRPMRRAVAIAQTVAAGDLTSRIEADSKDETGVLIAALGEMNDSLAAIVQKVRDVSDSISTGTREIEAGNTDLSARTEEQAASLEETAASMEELTSTVQHNAGNVATATQLAASATELAEKGGVAVSQVVETMGAINESSRSINEIIGVIDSIAFQTNILALNAAVEAARAGEQGRGFAVVASEVRTLAQRSANAAKDIKVLIQTTVQRIEQGNALVESTGATMGEIVGGVGRVSALMEDIRHATTEQRSGIEQVNDAVAQMDSTTQQNAALVEQAAAAASSLAQQAAVLVNTVSTFVVDAAPTPTGERPMLAAPER